MRTPYKSKTSWSAHIVTACELAASSSRVQNSCRLRVYYSTLGSYVHPTMSASTNLEAHLEDCLFYSPVLPNPGITQSLFVSQPTPSLCDCVSVFETDFHLTFHPAGILPSPLVDRMPS